MDAQTAQAIQTYASMALTVLTAITLFFLIRYTLETIRLRRSAQEQTTVTASLLKEAQRQNEQSLLPIVALGLQMKPVDEGHLVPIEWAEPQRRCRVLLLRNVGNGPAFNVAIRPVAGNTSVISFCHSDHLAVGEEEIVAPLLTREDPPFSTSGLEEIEKGVRSGELALPHKILISYKSVSGSRYRTTQTLQNDVTTGQLVIPFDQSQRVEAE